MQNQEDPVDQVHLVKLQLNSKTQHQYNIECPYLKNFNPKVCLQNKGKWPVYVPLIQKLHIQKEIHGSHSTINNKSSIPIDVRRMLQFPFDKHNLIIQTYNDPQTKKSKGQVLKITLQFALALTLKGKINYIDIQFKHANLKKDLSLFGKMSPYLQIQNQQWKFKTKIVKDGHLNPIFDQVVNIPFSTTFDRISIQIKDQSGGEKTIGYQQFYIFQFLGSQDDRQVELKKDHKMIGVLIFSVLDFEPQDF